MTAEGRQSFFYDKNTGAMVAMTQEMDATAEIHHIGDITFWDEQIRDNFNGTIDVDMVMDFSSRWYMILKEHPDEYQSPQTMPTVETPTSRTPKPFDNLSVDTSASLPVPYSSFIFGLFSVGFC